MDRIRILPIHSMIRIYNYIENDIGHGEQIELNNEASIYDMMDNFYWTENELNRFLKSNQYDKNSEYIHCSFNGIKSIAKNDIKDYLEYVLDDTPSGEILEIIQEEYYNNDMGEVKV